MDGPNVMSISYRKCHLPRPMFGPYSINISEGREEVGDYGFSLKNHVEVEVVMRILKIFTEVL